MLPFVVVCFASLLCCAWSRGMCALVVRCVDFILSNGVVVGKAKV